MLTVGVQSLQQLCRPHRHRGPPVVGTPNATNEGIQCREREGWKCCITGAYDMNHAIDLLSAGKDVPEGPRPIVRLPFAAIGTSQRCADFPHFNESLQFAHGGSKTAHIYHSGDGHGRQPCRQYEPTDICVCASRHVFPVSMGLEIPRLLFR
jgi:hypothetical protein